MVPNVFRDGKPQHVIWWLFSRCINCVLVDAVQYKETNEVDPYVRLSLFDPTSGGTEAFRSTTQMNDASPRCTLRAHEQRPHFPQILQSC